MSANTLLEVLEPFFDKTADFEASIDDHAFDVVDLFSMGSSLLAGRPQLVYVSLPEPLFPSFHDLTEEFMDARKRYFVSLMVVGLCASMLLGVVLTAIRNCIRCALDGQAGKAGYSPLKKDEGNCLARLVELILNHPVILFIIIFMQMGVLMYLAARCVVCGTMNDHMGVGYELWFVFLGMHCLGCHVEILVSAFRPGQLAHMVYPQKVFMTIMPVLSEKVDATKDIVLVAVAWYHGEHWCAALFLGVLLFSQGYFVFRREMRAELLDTYMPMMMAPLYLPHEEKAPLTSRGDEGKRAHYIDWLYAKGELLYAKMRNELQSVLLKQSTPARRIISMIEDLPQAVLSVYLALSGHASWFCLLSIGLGLIRLFLASTYVSRIIRRQCLPQVHERRVMAVLSGNRHLALELTAQLWDVEGEDLTSLVHEQDDKLLSTLASYVEEVAMTPEFDERAMTNLECVFLAVAAVMGDGDERERYLTDLPMWRKTFESSDVAEEVRKKTVKPMHVAAAIGNQKAISTLKLSLAKMEDMEDEAFLVGLGHGNTPMHIAMHFGHDKCIHHLIQPNTAPSCTMNAKNKWGQAPIHVAAERGHHDCITELQGCWVDFDLKNGRNETAMHVAAEKGHMECIAALTRCGASANAKNESEGTPMHVAAQWGNVDCIAALKVAGADVNAKANDEETPLHRAAMNGHVESIAKLIVAGADVNAADDNGGQTPLHNAAYKGHVECIVKFMVMGANINAASWDGKTPLHTAAYKGHVESIAKLMAWARTSMPRTTMGIRRCTMQRTKGTSSPSPLSWSGARTSIPRTAFGTRRCTVQRAQGMSSPSPSFWNGAPPRRQQPEAA
eukprot:TRINITY_DN14504_c0_g1_i1.p1 TRINITY_DN14504_c0_g1~~TRINITY_DN14504_c0_g1_i1.p1  ORF type:complete len:843 (-),score=164.93 TRINITY_DN14504_c0_g1_i1:798-3326(-)